MQVSLAPPERRDWNKGKEIIPNSLLPLKIEDKIPEIDF